jgi:hypothetical protein
MPEPAVLTAGIIAIADLEFTNFLKPSIDRSAKSLLHLSLEKDIPLNQKMVEIEKRLTGLKTAIRR